VSLRILSILLIHVESVLDEWEGTATEVAATWGIGCRVVLIFDPGKWTVRSRQIETLRRRAADKCFVNLHLEFFGSSVFVSGA